MKNEIEFETSEFNLDMNLDQCINKPLQPFEVTLIPSIFDRSVTCISTTSNTKQTAEILNTYNYNLYLLKLD
jgi:hypothetical protein